MPLISYTEKRFNAAHTEIITRANTVLNLYARQGYDLTLRQLYYQFVSRNWLPNTTRSYKLLGSVVSDARRAGRIDWDHIVDRTREYEAPTTWSGPGRIVRACSEQFRLDWWATQDYRPEVWVEKDALVGVIEVACRERRIPYLSCRGYISDSTIWQAGRRMRAWARAGQTPVVFHLGDHDPSGIDMSRDVAERLRLFSGSPVDVRRLALTMEQIEELSPPPNPAKDHRQPVRGVRGRARRRELGTRRLRAAVHYRPHRGARFGTGRPGGVGRRRGRRGGPPADLN